MWWCCYSGSNKEETIISFEDLFRTEVPIQCSLVSVHDGDTLRVTTQFPNITKPVSIVVRCSGYDCAEIAPKGPQRDKQDKLREKIMGTIGKYAFIQKIRAGIKIKFEGLDKYGRALGTVYLVKPMEEKSVNAWMVEQGYAYAYGGATKDSQTYVDAHFNKFYNMILDGSIETHIGPEGYKCIKELANEYKKFIT